MCLDTLLLVMVVPSSNILCKEYVALKIKFFHATYGLSCALCLVRVVRRPRFFVRLKSRPYGFGRLLINPRTLFEDSYRETGPTGVGHRRRRRRAQYRHEGWIRKVCFTTRPGEDCVVCVRHRRDGLWRRCSVFDVNSTPITLAP